MYLCLACVRVLNAVFTTFPKSTSVSFGEDATFSCAGYGQVLLWVVDDTGAMFHDGARYRTNVIKGLRESILTVFGTVENNNASILCQMIADDVIHNAPLAYLTLLGESVDFGLLERRKNGEFVNTYKRVRFLILFHILF